jgi:hypothetical protein
VVAEANGMPHQVLHETLKLKAGLFHLNIAADIPMTILHSTSFEAMDQVSFTRYTEFALQTILTEYVAGVKRPELIRKIDDIANIEYRSLNKVKDEAQTADAHE